jgi:hypothetical protein
MKRFLSLVIVLLLFVLSGCETKSKSFEELLDELNEFKNYSMILKNKTNTGYSREIHIREDADIILFRNEQKWPDMVDLEVVYFSGGYMYYYEDFKWDKKEYPKPELRKEFFDPFRLKIEWFEEADGKFILIEDKYADFYDSQEFRKDLKIDLYIEKNSIVINLLPEEDNIEEYQIIIKDINKTNLKLPELND